MAPVVAGLLFSIWLLVYAHRANHGIDGFPLDDPWIHLTYARNLAFHHSFSYFPGDPVTGGSTSPLYTLLLAAGFHVTHNEKLLSYVLGLVFHAGFLGMAALWGRARLGDAVWAAAFVLILALDARIAILSVSGMETSLFLFLVAAAFWAWAESRAIVLGLALGLGVWTRPDMMILAGSFALVMVAKRARHREKPGREFVWRAAIPFAALVLLYFVFNRITAGAFFPNTLRAKHAFYNDTKSFFLAHGVRDAVLTSAFWLLTPLAFVAIGREIVRWLRRRPAPCMAEAAWAVGLVLAYVCFVPFAHRFSRYLIPALPAIALLGLLLIRGAFASVSWRAPRGLGVAAILCVMVGAQVARKPTAAQMFQSNCAYHFVRHERCGRWLGENTPPTAVIAAHDVGAIAYYSERRVVDMVGLIQPDAVPHLHRPDYIEFLNQFFARERVTNVAFLDNWVHTFHMQIANEAPLWVADPNPEVLGVYAWTPGWTLMVPEDVAELNRIAIERIKAGDNAQALKLLERSIQVSPANPATWYLMGAVKSASGDVDIAKRAYQRAIELYPEFENARFSLGLQLTREGRNEDAIVVLEPLQRKNPAFPGLRPLWESLRPR